MNDLFKYEESNVKQKKRAEILTKSMDIFIRDGIYAPTMQQIADECNVSLRSLYYYYKSKEDLAVDVQIVCMDEYATKTYTNIDYSKTSYDALEVILNNTATTILENTKLIKYITAFDYYFFNDYPNEKYVNFLEKVFKNTLFTDALSMLENDQSIETFGEDIHTVFVTSVQSLLGYAQKIIYREKAMLSEKDESRGDLRVFVKIMLNGLKKR